MLVESQLNPILCFGHGHFLLFLRMVFHFHVRGPAFYPDSLGIFVHVCVKCLPSQTILRPHMQTHPLAQSKRGRHVLSWQHMQSSTKRIQGEHCLPLVRWRVNLSQWCHKKAVISMKVGLLLRKMGLCFDMSGLLLVKQWNIWRWWKTKPIVVVLSAISPLTPSQDTWSGRCLELDRVTLPTALYSLSLRKWSYHHCQYWQE